MQSFKAKPRRSELRCRQTTLRFPRQFKYGNLRAGAKPNGKARSADATVDVELRAPLFVPSTGIPIEHMAEVQAAVHELERQLPAMGVSSQYQINAEVGCTIKHEHARFMAQENVDGTGNHQLLVQPPINVAPIFFFFVLLALSARTVNADQVQLIADYPNRRPFLTQNSDALSGKQAADVCFRLALFFVIAETA